MDREKGVVHREPCKCRVGPRREEQGGAGLAGGIEHADATRVDRAGWVVQGVEQKTVED